MLLHCRVENFGPLLALCLYFTAVPPYISPSLQGSKASVRTPRLVSWHKNKKNAGRIALDRFSACFNLHSRTISPQDASQPPAAPMGLALTRHPRHPHNHTSNTRLPPPATHPRPALCRIFKIVAIAEDIWW
jgi:hypothetical protein